MIINYKRNFLNIEEVWGKTDLGAKKKADISLNVHLLLSEPDNHVNKKRGNWDCLEVCVPNYLIDLHQAEDELFKNINRSTRADIRKALEKDMLVYFESEYPTDEQINEFTLFYNSFAKEKNITPCYKDKLLEFRDHDSLIFTYVKDQQGHILCAGMLLKDHKNKQLYGLYGVSLRLTKNSNREKRLIGRANKFLHWKEIQSAKERGMDWYNFGGKVFRKEDQGVNDFKKGFGAIRGYDRNVFTANGILGKISIFILNRKWRKIFKHYQSESSL